MEVVEEVEEEEEEGEREEREVEEEKREKKVFKRERRESSVDRDYYASISSGSSSTASLKLSSLASYTVLSFAGSRITSAALPRLVIPA